MEFHAESLLKSGKDFLSKMCALWDSNARERKENRKENSSAHCIFFFHFSLYPKDEVRAYFVLIQNPVFASQSSYSIFAQLLRQIVELPTADHQLLVSWFKT